MKQAIEANLYYSFTNWKIFGDYFGTALDRLTSKIFKDLSGRYRPHLDKGLSNAVIDGSHIIARANKTENASHISRYKMRQKFSKQANQSQIARVF